jgi:uncharacterized protein (UPF0548 family)
MTAPRRAAGELNYDGIGSTEHGPLPPHLESVITRTPLGEGIATYRRVAEGILSWRLQRGAGLRVRAESEAVVPGTRVVSGFGIGPFRINAPCEVVWVRCPLPGDGPQSAGFGYGTLPGHPVRGEEAFEVELDGDGRVTLVITAFGAPSNWFYAAGGALTAWARRRITSRYIESARELAAGKS